MKPIYLCASNILAISLTLLKFSKIDYNHAQPRLTAVFDGFYVQRIKVQWVGIYYKHMVHSTTLHNAIFLCTKKQNSLK